MSSLTHPFQQLTDWLLHISKTGASSLIAELIVNPSARRGSNLLNLLHRYCYWVVLAVVLVISNFFAHVHLAEGNRRALLLLGSYLAYVLVLEVYARFYWGIYEQSWFRKLRIILNSLWITLLIALSPVDHVYFWFLYTLPISQVIIFFRKRGFLLVTLGIVTLYLLVCYYFTQDATGQPLMSFSLVILNSLILSWLALIMYWWVLGVNKAKDRMIHVSSQRLEKLEQINRHINALHTRKDILATVLQEGIEALGVQNGSVMLIEQDSLPIVAWMVDGRLNSPKEHPILRKSEGVAGHVIATRQSWLCHDTAADPHFAPSASQRIIKSLISVPIWSEGDQVLGVINADSPERYFFNNSDVEFLEAVASDMAIAITKARLYESVLVQRDDLRQMVATLLDLHKATNEFQSELNLTELLDLISTHAAKLLKADAACILLCDEQRQWLTIRGACNLSPAVVEGTRDRIGESIAGRVFARQNPIIEHDIPNSRLFHNPSAAEEGVMAVISTPLWEGKHIIGTLDVLSKSDAQAFAKEDLKILALMARHAEVAIRNAKRFEHGRNRNRAHELAQRVMSEADEKEADERMEIMIQALTDALQSETPHLSFRLVLKNEGGSWLYTPPAPKRLKPTVNLPWRLAERESLLAHIANAKKPLFFADVAEFSRYCVQHHLQPVGETPLRAWLGIPLIVGEQSVGALIFQDGVSEEPFSAHQQEFLQTISNHLSGAFYSAWLTQQQSTLFDKLKLLQKAGEVIMLLGEEHEDWMWHAILTLATAHYGLRFERAVLFLAEQNGSQIKGRIGIGHFNYAHALQDWTQDEQTGMDFAQYLALLQTDALTPTPIEQFVQGWSFPISRQTEDTDGKPDAFATLLAKGEILIVPASEAANQLPPAFVEKFGSHEYVLVPVKAGARIFGFVVLSSPFKNEPYDRTSLVYFDTLTNQSALLYEKLHYERKLEQFLEIPLQIQAKAISQPLNLSLTQICERVKAMLEADLVAIYPLKNVAGRLEYDAENAGGIGNQAQDGAPVTYSSQSFGALAIESGETVAISDVKEADLSEGRTEYQGQSILLHPMLQKEGMRSMLAVPIQDARSGQPNGLLYVSYRYPRNFQAEELSLVKALAGLANNTINDWRAMHGLRNVLESRQQELQLLGEVLEKSLQEGMSQTELITLILKKVQTLLHPLQSNVHMLIQGWRRMTYPQVSVDPIEVYDIYQLDADQELFSQRIRCAAYDARYASQERLMIAIESRTSALGWFAIYLNSAQDTGNQDTDNTEEKPSIEAGQLQMLKYLADATASALEEMKRTESMQTLLKAADLMTRPIGLSETLDVITKQIKRTLPGIATATIWHVDPERKKLILGSSFGLLEKSAVDTKASLSNGTVGEVMALNEGFLEVDAQNHPIFRHSPFVAREEVVSAAAFPLRVHDEAIGAIFFNYRHRHEFSEDERVLFPLLVGVISASVNNALHLERAKFEQKRLDAALQITETVGTTLSLEQTLYNIIATLKNLYPNVTPRILLYNEGTDQLELIHNLLPDETNPLRFKHIEGLPLDHNSLIGSLALQSLQENREIWRSFANVLQESAYQPMRTATQSACAVTLMSEDEEPALSLSKETLKKKLVGILLFESEQLAAFNEADEKIIVGLARQIRLAIERVQRNTKLRFQSSIIGATSWIGPIVHDVNKLTGHIRRRTSWLGEETLSDEGRRFLKEIDHYVAEYAQLIPDSPLKPGEFESIDIDKELELWVAETVQKRAVDIQVEYELQAEGALAKGQRRAFKRAIYDLVRNALESMGWSRGQSLKISTRLQRRQNRIQIRIADNGAGIPADVQSKIFNEPTSSKGIGRGFGLLYVRAAIEAMGGRVELLSSTPNKGAVFAVWLQVANDQQNEGMTG